ncbi:MAG: hypothetical protein V7641_1588 [Blastocatellia bacterium]
MLLAAAPIVLSTRLMRSSLASEPSSASPVTLPSAKAEIADHYGKLPLSFEANEGQAEREVKFISRGPGYDLFLTATSAVLTLRQPRTPADKFKPPTLTEQGASNQPPDASVLRLKMVGANPQSHAEGEEQLPGKTNYLIGDDPRQWHVNIPTYRKVYYTDIYPKVDLVYYGNRTELEYDFVVAPGGDVQAIGFRFEETDQMTLDDAGDLHLALKESEVTLRKPVIYQLTDQGERCEVGGEYVIQGKEVRFKAGVFDARKPLVIDPVLSYSTMLGGGGNEYASGIAVDSSGSAYITGGNNSGGFPTTPGAFQTNSSFYSNAFVTKLDPTGTSLVYSTYLNGSGFTSGTAIAVDSSGNAYVTGKTNASDFPTVNPIRSSTSNFYKSVDSGGHWNGQVIGSPSGAVNVLAVDPLAPNTMYAGMSPITGGGIYKTTDGGSNWIALNTGVTNVNCAALAVNPLSPTTLYASLVTNGSPGGGLYKSTDGGSSWTILTNGLSGVTVSALAIDPTSPTTVYAGGSFDGVYKSTDGGASWTKYTAGLTYGGPSAIAVDPMTPQTLYVCAGGGGVFKSTNGGANWGQVNTGLTTTTVHTLTIDPASTIYAGTSGGGVFKSTNGGGSWTPFNNGISGYIQVSSLALSSSASSTLYLGTGDGKIFKTIDGGNNWTKVYETLTRTSFTALAINPVAATVYAGAYLSGGSLNDYEGFVSKLNANGSGLVYSTYLGGGGDDFANGIAVDSSGSAVVVGQTTSSSFPNVNAYQSTLSGANDAFVTKFNATGNALLYSTYLGGSGSIDIAYGVAVDGAGNAYVTGTTTSANFPTLNAFQPIIGDTFAGDAFVTKLNSSGTLAYSTFLGGADMDIGWGIAVDSTGNAYVTGQAGFNFPLANPIQPTNVGGDAFVTKLNSAGSGLIYSTYIGGSSPEVGRGIAVDSAGNAYVTGYTDSADFPVMPGALRTKSPFFQSADGGGNWNNDNYGLKSDIVTVLTLDPVKSSTIYAGTRSGVYKSTDGGQSWSASNNGLAQPTVVALVVDPATPSTVYLAARFTDFNNSRGVYKSTNGGNTWNAANTGLSVTDVLSLAIDPVTPSTLYAGVYGNGVFKSVDGGANWTVQGSQTLVFVDTIAIDPGTPTTIYAGVDSSPGGAFKSTDGGVNWQGINNGLTSTFIKRIVIDPFTTSTLYASTGNGIFKSVNGATSWTSLTTSFSGPIIIDPVTPTTLYTTSSTFGGGIFKSTDGGNTWAPVNRGLTYPFVSSVIIDPKAPAKLYAGVNVFPGDDDAFVVKLNPSGTALLYSTLLGGNRAANDSFYLNDEGYAIAVDAAGSAYVAGQTRSPDFPVTPNAYQPFNRGFADAFISKLTMSYLISGHVLDGNNAPVSGASVTLSDGVSFSSVVTESDGAYQFSHLREGGNFTVSAAKPTFTMTPASQSFSNLHGNQTVTFIATPTSTPFYTVSGHVTNNSAALSGVTVTLSGSQQNVTTTDGNGVYSFTLAGGGNYTLTPSLFGFTFSPANRTLNNLSADQAADFASTRQNFVVTSANDHGPGTLRQAIMDANASPGLDMIVFNIPGAGVHAINLQLALPEITSPVVIDASTQPGYAGTPLVELNGAATNANAGFAISAGGSTIRGFTINRLNSGAGISLNGGNGNVIQGNYIGLDSTGTLDLGNHTGISIYNSSNNLIGGASPAARNVISGNNFHGMEMNGSGNRVQGNFIGTNASGSAAVFNGINGIEFVNFSGIPPNTNNIIGGTAPGEGNLISGNQRGINSDSSGTVIQGNLIGTDATGTAAIGNTSTGISAGGSDTLIGGTAPGARNVISGNYMGVQISGAQSRLQGNFIGTDITGTVALGNTAGGVSTGDHALIGGTAPEARNIISGNGGANVLLGYSGGDTATIQGNYIGTDVTGKFALANPTSGIVVYSINNLIGGTAPGAGNVIAGNKSGIEIGGSTTATLTGNLVQGNLIGLNATGDAPLPNRLDGVAISVASDNTIGGEGTAGNTIAFNGRNGIAISSGTGNRILRNSIFSNGALGIDLGLTGVTANDPGDADDGANNLQNFPVLTSVTPNGGGTTIQGTLNSMPSTSFRIDFYSNAAGDPSGNGEGARFFDTTSVTTDANGNAIINFISSMTLASGRVITATATDSAGNTSEFSPCDSSNATGSAQFSSATYKVLEDVGSAVITVIRVGGSKGTLSVNYSTANGTATAGSDYTAVSGTLVFADGEITKTINIPIANDGVTEPDETVQLALAAVTNLETLGYPPTATMIIQDSSTPLVLTASNIDVPEGDSGTKDVVVTVSLSAETGRTVSVDYNTIALSATSGVDFVAASGHLTFAPGVSTQGITVSIIGDTLHELDETFRVTLSNPVNATIGIISTVRILDDDPLTISAVAVSRQQGSPASNSTIANVTALHQPLNTLIVTVNGATSATVNGVTVSNISVSAAGVVTADVVAGCSATDAFFMLTVTDSASATANDYLFVTVSANSPPAVGNYPDTVVQPGGTVTAIPDVAPADNNSVTSVTAVAEPAGFTGSFTGNVSSGGVTVMNANPLGTYKVTVTLTDNCNATTTRIFMLTVNSCGASLSKSQQSFGAQGGSDTVGVTINAGCTWTATSNNTWITVTGGGSGSGNGTVSYSVDQNINGASRSGTLTIAGQTFTVNQAASGKKAFDFDGDGKADVAVFRPSTGTWYINNSSNGSTTVEVWGTSGDVPVAADYDGDGKTDIAVWRPSNGTWYILKSSDGTLLLAGWGISTDKPAPADYDGDGKADVAVWRPSNGTWYIQQSSNGALIVVGWGASGDVPIAGDFDGDGKADAAVFRPSTGLWYINNSSNGTTTVVAWGTNGDVPVATDYDGDGKTDVAVWRPSNGTWYIQKSSNGALQLAGWGINTDKPAAADYDGDGKADVVVWRPSNGTWYIQQSSNGAFVVVGWGTSGDVPISGIP